MPKTKTYHTEAIYLSNRIQLQLKKILHYPCTLVEAPMGYGKSTAIKEYFKRENVHILWQKIFNESISEFWSSFCRQFRELDAVRAERLKQLGCPDDNSSMEKALELIQDMLPPSGKTIFVMDDYHLVDCPEVNGFIEYLLWNELTDFHLVLTARYTRFPNLEELTLKGYLLHIQKGALEFTTEEIVSYYRLCGLFPKADEVSRLYSYTEGWVSALYLLMLNYKDKGTFIMPPNIAVLIEKTVYSPFSDEIKGFLLHICLFDTFTLEQAAYMWGKENTEKLLDELIGRNAFISCDEKSKVYQVHKIFSEFLKRLLEHKKKEEKDKLYQKAAEWFAQTGDTISAMHYAYLAKNFDHLFFTLEADQGHSMLNENQKELIVYFEECPEKIRHRHPVALLIYALCLFSYNETERFSNVSEELYQLLTDGSIKSDIAQELMGEFEILLSFSEYNNIKNMLGHYKKAGTLLRNSAKFMDTRGGWTFGSPSVLYMFHRERGKLENEVELLKEAMPYYDRLVKGHGRGAELVMEAERSYYCGDFGSAEITIHKALYLANSSRQEDIVLCARFLQARIAIGKGDYAYAVYSLNKLREDMENGNLMHTLDLCDAFLKANLRQRQEIPQWISEGNFLSSKIYFPAMAFFNIVYGRVLLIQGEYHKLLGSVDHFIETASIFPNLLGQIYTYIFAAAAYEKLFRYEAALEALRRALDMALPDGIRIPFVENGDMIKPVLEKLYHHGEYREFISSLFELYTPYQQSVQRILSDYFTLKRPELTERETEIARLVAQGLSNREIGGKLYITQNTVKTMLKRIFEKLEISSRAMLKQHIDSQR